MTDQTTDATPESPLAGGPSGVHVTEPTPAPSEGVDAAFAALEKEGVDRASFDKYYKEDKGFDWQSYAKELHFKQSQQKPADPAPAKEADAGPPKDINLDGDTDEADAEVVDIIERAGLTAEDVRNAIIQNEGQLPEEMKQALRDVGVPDAIMDEYASMGYDNYVANHNAIMDRFGGDEGFQNVVAWAKENLSQEERDQYTALLAQPGWEAVVDTLVTRAASGATESPRPKTVEPGNAQPGGSGDVKPFATEDEKNAAFMDPRYKTDPHYRNQVWLRAQATPMTYNPRSHTAGL